jgi:subtilase family serine protease
VAAALLLLTAMPVGSAPVFQPEAQIPVPQGIGAAALKDATVFGTVPPDTPETVSFVLDARNLAQLEGSVAAGMPGGYLSVGQFAAAYGQTPANVSALEGYLAHYGITTYAYPDGLDVTATGTAGEFDNALSVEQNEYVVPAVPARFGQAARPAMTIHGTPQSPLLPANLARFVLSILGLTNYPTFGSLAVHEPPLANGVNPPAVQTGALTPENFASQYDLDPLYARANGSGTTIGVVTLASVNPSDPETFWSSILGIQTKPNRINLINVDGGSGPVSLGSGSDETTLDVEQSGALAPQANIDVYEAPNTDFGFVDAFFDAASQNVADTVSASWGESETVIQAAVNTGEESANYAISFDEAFLEMAAQGQSAFVSAGDYGAYTAAEDLGSTNLSAGNPDSSPWVVSAGGTTLPGTIPLTSETSSSSTSAKITAQRTWGWDWLWPYYSLFLCSSPSSTTPVPCTSEAEFAEQSPIGGGGGFSVYEPTPAYQQGVNSANQFSAVEYLIPTDYVEADGLYLPSAWNFNPTPYVTTGVGYGRATPDVSTDADPFTGYEVYDSQYTPDPLEAGWGGTSFVAPQLNGATDLIDSYLGHRVGFWNPAVYKFAATRNSPFTPLDTAGTNNDNLYYSGTPGHVYNVGSGLGYPDFAKLTADFARP